MYGSYGTSQPTTQLAGERGRGGAVREKWRGRAGAPRLPQSLLHWTGVTGCWALGLRDWCWDRAKPRSGKERAGLQFPHQSGMEQGTEDPGAHQLNIPCAGKPRPPSCLPSIPAGRVASHRLFSPFLTMGNLLVRKPHCPGTQQSTRRRQHVCPGSRSWWWQVWDPARGFWSTAAAFPGGHRPVDGRARAPEPEVASSWMVARSPGRAQSEVPVDSHSQGLVTGLGVQGQSPEGEARGPWKLCGQTLPPIQPSSTSVPFQKAGREHVHPDQGPCSPWLPKQMTTNHTHKLSCGLEVRRNGRAVFPLEAMIIHFVCQRAWTKGCP